MKSVPSIQALLKALSVISIASTLFGCSFYPDVNRDPAKNNKVTFQRDAVDCAQSYPESGSGVHVK